MPRNPIYFESIEVGEKIEAIPRTVTETDVWTFAYLTADFSLYILMWSSLRRPFSENQ